MHTELHFLKVYETTIIEFKKHSIKTIRSPTNI